ncbi:MAG: SH3 domain-containing protein [Clostridia bacterium]|nr:SH3 domain-containing protein [Clostridia bacterium]
MDFFKKSVSLIVMAVMLFTTAVNTCLLHSYAATVTTAYIEGTNINVRTGPSTTSTIIEKLSNTSVTVIGTEKIDENNIWYKVTYHNGTEQITGYIFYDKSYIRIVTYNPDTSFEEKLKAFPESYRDALRDLHAAYPNWEFIPDPVAKSFSDAVAEQTVKMRKQVQMSSQPVSWRSMGSGSYTWSTGKWVETNGGWTGASREIIAYYMDPRNFLSSSTVYMFLEQSYNSAVQNKAGVEQIIKGTFLATNYTPATDEPGGGSYAEVIMLAAKASGVNPYIIASKIIQEQGSKGTSALISGTYNDTYKGYYNFFNVSASGSTNAEVVANGLAYAKAKDWNTRYKSILGGAQFLAKNYISKGQDTYYYQDFNVHGNVAWQYAQAVHDAYNKGTSLKKTYESYTDMSLSFRIPVFTDMPETAAEKPASSNKKNNYYLSELSVSGLTPSFEMYTYSYALAVSGNTALKVAAVNGATIASSKEIALKKGENQVVISVKSETGYLNNYTISVNASKECTLYLTSDGKLPSGATEEPPEEKVIMLGDTSGDGKITIVDLARVQMHILKVKTLTGDNLNAGDINKDGKVNIVDLARVQMHILKVKLIEQ